MPEVLKHNFRELKVWRKAIELVNDVYRITEGFPKEEVFGLRQQVRKSAVSIPSNIAEGCGRNTDPQLIRYLDIAQGSACELETQLLIAKNLGFIPKEELSVISKNLDEIQRMIQGFKNTLE